MEEQKCCISINKIKINNIIHHLPLNLIQHRESSLYSFSLTYFIIPSLIEVLHLQVEVLDDDVLVKELIVIFIEVLVLIPRKLIEH